MEPLSPFMADRAHKALTFVLDQVERDVPTDLIIARLIDHHGASLRYASGTHNLRCAGICSSNTANMASALLGGWRRNAINALSIMI